MVETNKTFDLKQYRKNYYRNNKELIQKRSRERYAANPERESELRKKYRRREKQDVINAYGGICACCKENQLEFLAIDHIDGNGREQRKSVNAANGGKKFYVWLIRNDYPDLNLRVLCHNCNMSLGMYGYCPHGNVPAQICTTGINNGKIKRSTVMPN